MTPASDEGEEELSAIAPRSVGLSGVARTASSRTLPLHGVEFDIDAAGLFQVVLQIFVHRQRQHLAGAGRRNHYLEGQRLLHGVAGLNEQRLAPRRVEAVAIDRVAEPGILRLQPADRRLGRAVEEDRK